MGTLTIGRVGLDVTIADPRDWFAEVQIGVPSHRVSGLLVGTSLADAQALRTELGYQVGATVPVTWSTDSTFDGFYVLEGALVEARHELASLQGFRFYFEALLRRVGGESSTEHQSLLTGTLIDNQHGLIQSEVVFWHSPPVGALAYDGGSVGTPTAWTRTTEDGTIPVLLGLDTGVDPKWSVAPSGYYDGGCYVKVGGYLRAGTDAPNTPGNWEIGNKLVRVTPGGGGTSNGRIIVAHWDGTTYDPITYNIKFATTSALPEFHSVTIIKNTAELVVIRLVRDAEEAPATTHRHVLDLAIRRGSLTVNGYFTWTGGATTWSLDRDSAEAGTAITPTGAASAVALRATANDGAGNRYVMGSSRTTTKDTTNGGLDFASTKTFDFFLGCEIGGTGAAANDQAADQCLQTLGAFTETVRAVRR